MRGDYLFIFGSRGLLLLWCHFFFSCGFSRGVNNTVIMMQIGCIDGNVLFRLISSRLVGV